MGGTREAMGIFDICLAVAERTNPTSKEPWLRGHRRAYRSYPRLKVRKGGGEEIPLVQGKEQWLHFAGAAVKRYPTPEARGSGWEDQPHVRGAMAARVQESLEELSHVEGQEGRQ